MADDPFDYTRLVQRALLGVVRDALRLAASEGLHGEHHFYLTFRTDAPGVKMPPRLRAEYQQEMTIVLQHVFWNLAADDEKFAVTLRFGGAPEHIEVPFAALTAFVDPAAHFGLRFEQTFSEVAGPGALTPSPASTPPSSAPRAKASASPRAARPALAPRPARPTLAAAPTKRAPRKRAPVLVPPPAGSATKVVDLAAFRRQTGDKDDDKD